MKILAKACLVVVLASVCVAEARAATCSVSGVTLAFGSYNSLKPGHTDVAGNIAVTCTGTAGEPVSYSIGLNAGGSGAFAQRRMRPPNASALNYNIYVSAARSVVWGDGNSGTSLVTDAFSLTGASATRNYAVYGRIFARQNAPVGTYSDSIVATLTF